MKYKVEILYSLGLLIITAFFMVITYDSQEVNPEITINNYQADITIDNDGDMTVHEIWDMNYRGDYNVRFRDIEYDKFPKNYPLPYSYDDDAEFNTSDYSMEFYKDEIDKSDEVRFGYSLRFDFDEQFEKITCPSDLSWKCESFFVDATKVYGLSGDVRFVYNYTIENVITEYSDISELNWILFEYAENTVAKGQVNITLPNAFDSYYFYHPELDLNEPIKEDNTISFTFTNKTNNEPLAFRILVPTTTFTSIESNNIFIDEGMNKQIIMDYEQNLIDNQEVYANSDIILFLSTLVSSIIIGLLTVFIIKRTYFKAPAIEPKSNVVSPPSEHSPGVVGYLYNDETSSPEDISATILDLINRGFLNVNDDSIFNNDEFEIDDLIKSEKQRIAYINDPMSKYDTIMSPIDIKTTYDFEEKFDVELVLNTEKDLSDLNSYESLLVEYYINKLGDGEKVSLEAIKKINEKNSSASEFINFTTKFQVEVKKEADAYGFYDKSQINKKRTLSMISTAVPLVIGVALILVNSFLHIYNVLTALPILCTMAYTFLSISTIKTRSVWGEQLYSDWTSYIENLKNHHILKTSNISDVEFWDENLVYATVFNIAEKVLDEIEADIPIGEIDNEVNPTYTTRRYNRYTHHYFRRNLTRIHTRNHTSASVTVSRNSSSSGGYRSGGGSFGGGGGGGRSR